MASREFASVIVCLTFILHVVTSQFAIPNVEIQAISPVGFRASIIDVPGIKLFGFHGKVDEGVEENQRTLNGEALRAEGGRWIAADTNTQLNVGDTIQYWVFVQFESLGYRKDKQVFTVSKLVPINTPWTPTSGGTKMPTAAACESPSVTTVRNWKGPPICKGAVIFNDNFEKLDTAKWQVEQRLSDDRQEYEFVSYQKSRVDVSNNKLVISTSLQFTEPGFDNDTNSIFTGTLDLSAGCTSMIDFQCSVEALGSTIVPPIISGRVNTKNSFSFKYGKIEIKAKMPMGDWIYPQLYLEPARSKYGVNGYTSGVIRVAFARGNLNLQGNGEQYGNTVLSGGVLLDQFEPCRSKGTVKNPATSTQWSSKYHTYGIIWSPDGFTLSVDGTVYGQIIPPDGGFKSYKNSCPSMTTDVSRWNTKMAPFDDEFYITLGLGVGGISDFPNGIGNKKWTSTDPKAMSNFWKDFGTWYNTWGTSETRDLFIDSVKIWAL